MERKESQHAHPTIMLTHSRERVKLLREKLRKYQQTLDPRMSWTEQLIFSASTAYKTAILDRLLTEGMVDLESIGIELQRAARDHFDPETFKIAGEVIHDYSLTGGKNTVFGTGITGRRNPRPRDIPNSTINYDETVVFPVKKVT